MKRFLLSLLLSSSYFSVFAIDYYSQAGQTDPNTLASWNTLQGGGGTAPGSFTNAADRFIIQDGHSMTTTAAWTVSAIVINTGGTLQGDHAIPLSGIFQIDDGGTYIHNNNGSVAQSTPTSIFGGTESFAANSNFEIRNWINHLVGLPDQPAITWGNLIIDLQVDLVGDWNWDIEDGTTLTIAGNLEIRENYVTTARELRITGDGIQTVNIGGDFRLGKSSGGPIVMVAIKKTSAIPPLTGYTTMQVEGDVFLNGADLDLGVEADPNTIGLYELRFKGGFSIGIKGVVIRSSATLNAPYLVANGTVDQSVICFGGGMGCNFRIALGATVNINYHFGTTKLIAILGTFNQNGWNINTNSLLEVAGGTFNSDGPLTLGIGCNACSNDGTYNTGSDTWCTSAGTKGTVNFTDNVVTLNNNISTTFLSAGHLTASSAGDIYFVNSSAISISPATFDAGYFVMPNSIFSLDENSYVAGGNAGFNGNGGTLRIGSPDGITATGNTSAGNVRVGGTKNYNNAGINSFKYFGTNPQFTGDGLPGTIDGILKISNTSDAGVGANVTLSQPTTIAGSVDLTKGKLLTTSTNLLTIEDNATATGSSDSYVIGPVRKIGDEDFNFPIGKGNIYSPIGITGVSGSDASDVFTAEYFRSNPQTDIGNMPAPGSNIDHISSVEYWTLDRDNGSAVKKVSLTVNEESFWQNMSGVFVSRYDGSGWTNEGTEITEGPVTMPSGYQTGIIRSVNALSDFGYFTLATDVPAVTYNIFHKTSSGVNQTAQPREAGMKFRVTQPGYITGIRFYKGVANTGTHTGNLWNSAGTNLASATFTGETASGWQQVLFTTSVAVTPGITYIASYFTPTGNHAITTNYFTSAVVNGPLRALAAGEDGGNGVFINSPVSAFPNTSSSVSSNFWVDVTFTTSVGPDVTPPIVTSVSPVNGATDISAATTVIANFSEALNPSTVTTSTFVLKDAGSNIITAAVSASSGQITLTPSSPLALETVYTATITSGASGVKDLAGNALASDYTWPFTTDNAYNIFPPTSSGVNQFAQPREVGMKFRVTQPGYITGIRFYKGVANTGTHTGHLWSNTGTSLATVIFTGETASGWQQALFATPVAVTPGVTYMASYFTPTGNHAITTNFFTSAVVNGPVRALASSEDGGNGHFKNSAIPTFPSTTSSILSNFWIDVAFTTGAGTKLMTQTSALPKDEETTGQKLNVKVTPNPSENLFKLIVMSDDKAPVSIRIMDISGRVLERYEKVTAGSLTEVGKSLKGGAYFAEVIQGDKRKVVKIIKVN